MREIRSQLRNPWRPSFKAASFTFLISAEVRYSLLRTSRFLGFAGGEVLDLVLVPALDLGADLPLRALDLGNFAENDVWDLGFGMAGVIFSSRCH